MGDTGFDGDITGNTLSSQVADLKKDKQLNGKSVNTEDSFAVMGSLLNGNKVVKMETADLALVA